MKTTEQQLIAFGKEQAKIIGAHYKMLGNKKLTHDQYEEARSRSDQAVSLVKYMAMHLENRHFAVILLSSAGMPGYINMR